MAMSASCLIALLFVGVADAAQPSTCGDDCEGMGLLQLAMGQDMPHFWDQSKAQHQACTKAPPHSALIVIDMQNDFINGSLPVAGAAGIIPTINNLVALEGWSFIGFTLDYHPQNHASFAANSPRATGVFTHVKMEYTDELKLCGREYHEIYGGSSAPSCSNSDIKHTFNQTLWPVHCVQHTFGQQLHKDVHVPTSAVQVRKGYSAVVDSYGAFENNIGMVESNLPALLHLAGAKHVYIVGLALDYCVKYTSLQSSKHFTTSVIVDATRPVSQQAGDAAVDELKSSGVTVVDSASLMTCS